MSEAPVEPEKPPVSWRRLAIALAVFGVYFAVILVPKLWPEFATSGEFAVWLLSLPLVLLGLLGLLLLGVIGGIRARRGGAPVRARHRARVEVSLIGCLVFVFAIALARAIPGNLPAGSHLLEFDAEVWRDPVSAEFVPDDISLRQKMLGSLVEQLEATQDRELLERLLGPSLDTTHFEDSANDLIYQLGRERTWLFGIDSEWLLIWLDGSDHYERYDIYTD
jgi:hypothetical protein